MGPERWAESMLALVLVSGSLFYQPSPNAAPWHRPHQTPSWILGQKLPCSISPASGCPLLQHPPIIARCGAFPHSHHPGPIPPWDSLTHCPREESLEQGSPCWWGRGSSLSYHSCLGGQIVSLKKVALTLLRGVISRSQAVFHPVHKHLNLAL